jgi:DNA ligase-1
MPTTRGPMFSRPGFLVIVVFLLATGLARVALADERPSAPALLLANVFQNQAEVSRYWVSEKLDGARAFWDGKSLWFRSGQVVHAPDWFTAGFPSRPLDGELWLGRGGFDRLSGIVRKQQAVDEEWRQVRYMVFELPEAPGTFSERIEAMRALVRTAALPWLQAVEQFRVANREELMRHMNEVVRAGGEGLMLHLADAPYATGRGDVLLKVKPWLDAEARVVGHVPGQGKYRGVLGALRVEMPDGRRFRIGTGFKDETRRAPPPVGAMITYRYRELNKNGLPRFASYLRRRETF